MGLSCFKPKIPPEVEEILKTLEQKSPDIIENCGKKKLEIELKKKDLYLKREKEVGEASSKSEDELKKLLLKYNKKELKLEKELVAYEVDKMHSLWELGLDLAEPLKKVTLKQLEKKLDNAPGPLKAGINMQINEVKAYSPKQFLNSPFGKPLKDALVKQGMSKNLLENYKKELVEDRKKRRKEERAKFSHVKQNEFPPEDELEFKVDDLYDSIFEEYKDAFLPEVMKKYLEMKEEEEEDNDD